MAPAPTRYDGCPEVCRELDHPGLRTDAEWTYHSGLETTLDQARIEAALERMGPTRGQQILHVGVGNSGLAERFAARVGLIDGLTVSPPEKTFADALRIPNYTVHFLSKYSREFVLTIENRYDYIVDNNLAGFSCCKYHFYRMLDNYLWCLRPDGRVLTEQLGLDWTAERDPRWQMTFEDLVALGERFPVTAARVTDTVYELRHADRG